MFKEKKGFIEYLVLFFTGVLITAMLIMRSETIVASVLKIFTILTPFYVAFGIAYILNHPINAIQERLKIKRAFAILVTYLGLVILVALFGRLLLPQLISSTVSLASELTTGASHIGPTLSQLDFGPLQQMVTDNLARITEYMGNFTTFLLDNLTNFFATVTSTVMNMVFGIIISIYMLLERDNMKKLFGKLTRTLLKPEHAEPFIDFAKEANNIFGHYITGLIVEAFIIGCLAFLGLSLLGVRYAIVLALIIMLTNVIPYVGPFIGAVPAIVTTLLYDPMLALWVALFIVVLQQVDGNFIGPKVMGNFIGLSPIWIILSITIGGGYGGLMGILLAIPTGAMLKIILGKLLQRLEEKRKAQQA